MAAAWTAAAVAIGGTAAGTRTSGLACSALGLLVVAVVVLVPGRPGRRWPTILAQGLPPVATIALVLLSTGGSLARDEEGPVSEAVDGGVPMTAVLRIAGEPSSLPPGAFGGGERFLVEAEVVGGVLRGTPFTSATPVVVLGGEPWSEVGTGDTVRAIGVGKASDRPGRAAAVFLPSSEPSIRRATGWLGATAALRTDFRTVAQRDGRDRGLLPGMVLGDRTTLDPTLTASMKTTGLTHLTAVSGANCSYVLAFAFIGLRATRLPRVPAAVAAVLALGAFVLLVRPEPSVLRAAVMGTIGVAAVLSGRGRVSLTLLMLSIIVLLAVDPWLSVSFAFMLSVGATLGLVVAGPAVAGALGRVMPRILAQVVAIPLTAQLFCTPILVLIQPSLPVFSLPANIAVSPVVPAVTLLGMVAVLALIGVPVLAHPLVVVAQVGTRWVGGVADTFASLPVTSLPWAAGASGAVLAGLVSATALFLLVASRAWPARRLVSGGVRPGVPGGVPSGAPGRVRSGASGGRRSGASGGRRRRDRRAGPQRRVGRGSLPPGADGAPVQQADDHGAGGPGVRWPSTALLVCLALAVLAAGAVGAVVLRAARAPASSDWILAVCDVGQGDGLVVATAPGHALVVDTGPDPAAMDRCLDAVGVEVIDALVITHLHEDHYGGIDGALRGRTVSALYYSSGEEELPRDVADAASDAGVRPDRLDAATALDLEGVQVHVRWPGTPASGGEENDASAVLDLVVPTPHRPVRILLTGDQEEDAAARMLRAVPDLAGGGVDILKIAHHGAKNGGTALIEQLRPSLALVSVGADNDYGHPHPVILDALRDAGVLIARTDELGSFVVRVAGSSLEIRPLD